MHKMSTLSSPSVIKNSHSFHRREKYGGRGEYKRKTRKTRKTSVKRQKEHIHVYFHTSLEHMTCFRSDPGQRASHSIVRCHRPLHVLLRFLSPAPRQSTVLQEKKNGLRMPRSFIFPLTSKTFFKKKPFASGRRKRGGAMVGAVGLGGWALTWVRANM